VTRNRTGGLVRTLILVLGVLLPVSVAAEVPLPTPSPAPSVPGLAQTPVESIGRTPPRLSFISGEVSFWRPGADDWAPAVVNTPLAPGDYVYAGQGANVEFQIDGRAFVRAAGETQLALTNQDLGFLQLAVSGGLVALDLREFPAGYSIEVGTPTASLTIDRAGYYLADVQPAGTAFTIDRGGRATMTAAGGTTYTIGSGQQVVVRGDGQGSVETRPAPQPSDWDRWNYARTDALLAAQSAQYMPLTMYGASDLDRYGTWRVDAEYGPVWVPQYQPADWVPYSTGRWMWDPYYGWTWVDDAPWGWAPYHYGRWVFVDRYWAWVPGPLVVRPAYSPALVGFFGYGGGVVAGGPIGWIALGWGEPIIPWWGPIWFVGRPCWIGWHGPHVVNNVHHVDKSRTVKATDIKHYRNTRVHKAAVVVPPEKFGTRHVREERLPRVDLARLQPMTSVRVKPSPASFVGDSGPTVLPPTRLADRSIVTRRALPEGRQGPRETDRPPRVSGARSGEAGARPDTAMRPPRPTIGDGGRPAPQTGELKRGGPTRQSIPTPPPPPVGRAAEPGSARIPGQPRGVERPATPGPGSVTRAPSREAREVPRPPASRQAPERPAIPPQPSRGGAQQGGSRIVTPPVSKPDQQFRGDMDALPLPQGRVERRMDWPHTLPRNPPQPPALSSPGRQSGTSQHRAPQVAPRGDWSGGHQVTPPAMRSPSTRDWGGSQSTGPQGRGGGGSRGGRGQR
jgi:hypothetical protein